MSSTIDRLIPSSLAAAPLLVLAALGLTPDRASGQEHGDGASPDTAVAARLQQTTAHLEQMLSTLRDSPSLEETWSEPPVLEAAVASGRRSTEVARELGALSATLDSLLGTEAAGENEALAEKLRQIQGGTERMASALRSVAARLEELRSVAHGEGGGAAHARGGGGAGHAHGAGSAGHHAGLHFSHPLFTESVSPDTKVRFDYDLRDLGTGEGTKHEFGVTAEWSLSRSVSVEAGVPYSASDEALGFTHASLKFANYALEEHGISLGYGIGVGLPTSGDSPGETHHGEEGGHGHAARTGVRPGSPAAEISPPAPRFNGGGGVHGSLGRDFYEFEPFFNLGWKSGRWELVGFTTFAVPSGLDEPSEGGTELAWNVSTLFQAAPEVQTVVELNAAHGLSGHPVGEDVVNLSPGVKLRPSGSSPVWLGLGGSLPLTSDQDYDGRLQVSFFYHFR